MQRARPGGRQLSIFASIGERRRPPAGAAPPQPRRGEARGGCWAEEDCRPWLGGSIALLQRQGDPYVGSAVDRDGRVGIDYGVYGVPETFVIDREGRIRYRHLGPVTAEVWRERLMPMVRSLR